MSQTASTIGLERCGESYLHINDNRGFIRQYACIEEHLNRGLKDFAIHLLANCYIVFLHDTINSNTKINPDIINFPKLRHVYHDMKNIVAGIRLEGQTLQHFNNRTTVWLPSVVAVIKAFDDLLGESPSLRQFYSGFVNTEFSES